jgi:hypothetical protein
LGIETLPAKASETQMQRLYDMRANTWDKVDPILWTKKGHSLATLLPALLTGNSWLILHRRHACGIDLSPGETKADSAGEHPAKG